MKTLSLQTEATVLQHALQGVVVYHQPQLVDAAIAGHRSVHGRRLPMITGNEDFSFLF
jgi:hypothetical protein